MRHDQWPCRNRRSMTRPLDVRVCTLIALSVCLTVVPVMAADEPEIRVAVGAEEIFVGESIDYHVEIRHVKNPPAPDVSALKEHFDVVANGDESRNQSSTFIINGRVSQQNVFSHVYHFRLTPKESGDLTIPPARAVIDGKSLTSDPLSVRVITPEEQDLVLVEITTNQTRVYPTQPFAVTARVLVKPLPKDTTTDPLAPLRRRPPHLQVNWVDTPAGLTSEDEKSNWLQPLLSDDGTGFTLNEVHSRSAGFFESPRAAVFNLFKGRETRTTLDGGEVNYFVYELTRTFTPERTGMYSFGPVLVKGTFVAGVERNEYSGRRLVAMAPATTVEVREVPSPRPATFCGGIGEYHVSAFANPTKLRVGDPLTLNIELRRGGQSGSLELVSAPDLSAIPDLSADFDLIDRNPTGRIEGAIKKFAYALRPRRPNVSIPALKITTFDPKQEKFLEISAAAIPLEVSEATKITAGDLVGSLPTSASPEIKTRAQGIFQNIANPAEVYDDRVNVSAWGGTTVAIWSLAGCVIASLTRYRRKSLDTGWQRRQFARRAAQRELAAARESLAQNQPQDALRHVRAALIGLVADVQNRIASGLTTADVAEALSPTVATEDRAAVLRLLESIESAEYGGLQAADPATAIESAASLISRVAPQLERGA